MITLSYKYGKVQIPERPSELPSFDGVRDIYCDIETNSGSRKVKGVYPYLDFQDIAGIAFTRDDEDTLWYVCVNHKYPKWDLPRDKIKEWIHTEFDKPKRWINHRLRFDCHFFWQKFGWYPRDIELIDTNTLAKIAYADRLSHELKPLCKEWLGLDVSMVDKVKTYLKTDKTQNYGDVPPDILAVYAAEDVFLNRKLFKWLDEKIPSDLDGIRETERLLCPVLFDMEASGLRFDPQQVAKENKRTIEQLLIDSQKISDLVGVEFKDSNQMMYDIICVRLGLPIIRWNDKKNPSFDKVALQEYLTLPEVVDSPEKRECIEAIRTYRDRYRYHSFYLEGITKHTSDDYCHPSYNPIVRTGRMSSSGPNIQQQTKESKLLILPDPGCEILSSDASQVELRIICHYIKAHNIIEAYKSDASLDMHSWVANEVGCVRSAAKNINFAIAYGAGEKKITSMVAANEDIIAEVIEKYGRDNIYANAQGRASHIMTLYKDTFPTLKDTANRATRAVKGRRRGRKNGYSINAFGRRRHLPNNRAHTAFNTIVQGTAMDYIKTRMIALSPRYNSFLRDRDISLRINVHDELAWQGPIGVFGDPEVKSHIMTTLEQSPIPFRVPFYWDYNRSSESWGKCA